MTFSSQRSGVTITSLSSKLSVVIPTLFGIIMLHEHLSLAAGIGIGLALVALFLVVMKKGEKTMTAEEEKAKPSLLIVLLPVFIFFGTGIGDILMKVTETANQSSDMSPMIAFIYFVSFIFGIILVVFDLVKRKSKWQWKSALGGIILGATNFFSTYSIYHAMRVFDNVVLFPIYNIGVVSLTALIGWLFFKEKLSWTNYLGLALAIIAVLLITVKL
jgi:drug/metabolite transporter (DMT)-like permease